MGFFKSISVHKPTPSSKSKFWINPNSGKEIQNWVFVLYDQISTFNPLITDPSKTCLIFIETSWKPNQRPYHKQKLILLLSAQRHFAMERGAEGFSILYQFEEGGYPSGLQSLWEKYRFPLVRSLEFQEREVQKEFEEWQSKDLKIQYELNPLFLSQFSEFRNIFPEGKKRLQETFYRAMRKKFGILMDDRGNPEGGKWNYDLANRSNWKKGDPQPMVPPWSSPDLLTKEVMDLIEEKYPNSYGSAESFGWPVTRTQALNWLDHFLDNSLEYFGKYEDAMDLEEPYLFHSLLSPMIHLGLLHPKEVLDKALKKYKEPKSKIPLESLEGFVRQILGWREFMRHIFTENADQYSKFNFFAHKKKLPEFFWDYSSGMRCIDSTIESVWRRGYSHHISRLMVLSNFANLYEISPQALNEWFWFAYVDAFEWVVKPNVIGMGTYADGGKTSTKPYIASANYIKKMAPSYCKNCKYKPDQILEETACPFNSLYWDFVGRNESYYASQGRPDYSLNHWRKFTQEKKLAIRKKASEIKKAWK